MSSPIVPIPDEQALAFGRALCERLGLDPEIVGDKVHWHIEGDEELAEIYLKVYLPAEEVLAMFNGAAVPKPR